MMLLKWRMKLAIVIQSSFVVPFIKMQKHSTTRTTGDIKMLSDAQTSDQKVFLIFH